MVPKSSSTGMSDLELEVELDMEGELPEEEIGDEEVDDQELDEEAPGDEETDEELDEEVEASSDDAPVAEAGYRDREYAERLFELSQAGMESEYEIAREVGGLLREIEDEVVTEHLFGLKKKFTNLAKRKLGRLARGVGRRALAKLRGKLGPVFKAALGPGLKAVLGATPQGQVALTALKAVGFEASADMPDRLDAFERMARMAREAYEQVVRGMTEQADEPQEAANLANRAFTTALQRARASGAPSRGGLGRGATTTRQGRVVRRIRLRRGETLVIRRD